MQNLHNKFEPIFNEQSRILILGTFPSVKSREEGFYYGHKQNRFWKVIAALTSEEVPKTIESKKQLLLKHEIAIWDVIESCEINGSSDASIKKVHPNDLSVILKNSRINTIFVNGRKAKQLYDYYQLPVCGIKAVQLPSTSPANASYSLEKLQNAWGIITNQLTSENI